MNSKLLFLPPAAFLVIFITVDIFSRLASYLAFRNKNKIEESKESYACGEDIPDHLAHPDYSTFFPYAFFFTLAHVATLIVATIPFIALSSFVLAFIYLLGVVVGFRLLFRREDGDY